jgi:hypothetical protein
VKNVKEVKNVEGSKGIEGSEGSKRSEGSEDQAALPKNSLPFKGRDRADVSPTFRSAL